MISMSERAKSILLVFLVTLSIVLSFFMRYGMARPYASSSAGEDREISPAVLSNILRPEDIIVNFGGMDHTPILDDSGYESAWREFQSIVFLGGGNSTAVTESDFADAMDYRSLTYKFAFPVPISYFNAANGKQYNPPVNTIKDVIILSGNSPTYYMYDGFDKYVRMNLGYRNNGIETIVSVNEEGSPLYSTAKDLGFTDSMSYDVLMPLDPKDITLPVIAPGLADGMDMNSLVSGFFDSGSMVRKIREMPGDTVYTDGRKGLKVYVDGRLEYTCSALSSARVDDVTAVKIASDFVTKHLPGIGNVSLAGVDEERDGYVVRYNIRYNGLHVYSRQYGFPITVEISDGQVTSMKAVCVGFSNENTETDIKVAALDAMDISFKGGLRHWDTLGMCYLADDGEIRAAWRAVDNGKTLYIDMENGKL